jgi:hypothetical protein
MNTGKCLYMTSGGFGGGFCRRCDSDSECDEAFYFSKLECKKAPQ